MFAASPTGPKINDRYEKFVEGFSRIVEDLIEKGGELTLTLGDKSCVVAVLPGLSHDQVCDFIVRSFEGLRNGE